MAWSPDSDHVLCGLYRRATVQVFSASDPEWTATISEGPAGVVAARFAPGGQHVLLTSDFQVRLSVWSLADQSCAYLRGPKHPCAGLAFSPDGSLLAVAGVSGGGPPGTPAGRRGRWCIGHAAALQRFRSSCSPSRQAASPPAQCQRLGGVLAHPLPLHTRLPAAALPRSAPTART